MITWQWQDRIGTMYFKSGDTSRAVNIYHGNCLAVLLYEYEQDDKVMYTLFAFFNDAAHLRECLKNDAFKGMNDIVLVLDSSNKLCRTIAVEFVRYMPNVTIRMVTDREQIVHEIEHPQGDC